MTKVKDTCFACGGTGEQWRSFGGKNFRIGRCIVCNGSGYVYTEARVKPDDVALIELMITLRCAQQAGVTRPCLRIEDHIFAYCAPNVEERIDEKINVFRIREGRMFRDSEPVGVLRVHSLYVNTDPKCTEAEAKRIIKLIEQDLTAAATAYGKATGACACCGQPFSALDSEPRYQSIDYIHAGCREAFGL